MRRRGACGPLWVLPLLVPVSPLLAGWELLPEDAGSLVVGPPRGAAALRGVVPTRPADRLGPGVVASFFVAPCEVVECVNGSARLGRAEHGHRPGEQQQEDDRRAQHRFARAAPHRLIKAFLFAG